MKFYNISNHPSTKWGEKQIAAARTMAARRYVETYRSGNYGPDGNDSPYDHEVKIGRLGDIIDIQFPNVPPAANLHQILDMAKTLVQDLDIKPSEQDGLNYNIAMVQGEFTLTMAIISELRKLNVMCVSACTERNTIENADGTKTVQFEFVQFREYPNLSVERIKEIPAPPEKCVLCGNANANYAICSPCANGFQE